MRVTWVHPSWRDLVIEHLAVDGNARERFLRGCSVNGALLALSVAGGGAGERRLPLLETDRDWDALTDRVYELAPELEHAALIGLLDGVAEANRRLLGQSADPEAASLARALLARTSVLWKPAHIPIPARELEAWLALARLLTPRPDLPPIAATWAELLPIGPPDLFDRPGLDRFADWLTIAELLFDYDPALRDRLRFPGRADEFVDRFLSSLTDQLPPGGREVAARALKCIDFLFPSLAARAEDTRQYLEIRDQQPPDEPAPWLGIPEPRREHGAPGRVDVARVLRDL